MAACRYRASKTVCRLFGEEVTSMVRWLGTPESALECEAFCMEYDRAGRERPRGRLFVAEGRVAFVLNKKVVPVGYWIVKNANGDLHFDDFRIQPVAVREPNVVG